MPCSYRIGTLLEMIRHLATEVMAANPSWTVRVCVQQALGEGVFQVRVPTGGRQKGETRDPHTHQPG